jgi:S-(hydroxymethyl)glutathione dehydrogenase/alcohol dehydrogenase
VQIIAVDLLDNRLEMANHFGATHRSTRLSEGGVDYSFEAIGNRRVAEQCFYCLAPRSTATLVGAIPAGQKVELNAGHFFVEKRIQGCSICVKCILPDYSTSLAIWFLLAGNVHT